MNTYTAEKDDVQVLLAPALPGDVAVIEMRGQTLLVQSGFYLASSEGIDVDTKCSGARTFFGREGLIMLKLRGTGTLIISSFGAIHPMELSVGEKEVKSSPRCFLDVFTSNQFGGVGVSRLLNASNPPFCASNYRV